MADTAMDEAAADTLPGAVGNVTVADAAVGDAAVGDADEMAVPAVVGQAREPFVPGSGDRVPAQLRLVLAGYAGIACLCAGGLAGAVAGVLVLVVYSDLDPDTSGPLAIGLALFGFLLCFGVVFPLWARSGFSRLLRRRSEPRTATVLASERGGRTLILDIPLSGPSRGYQSRSEVRLALWMKAGMLVPGETVNVYARPGVNRKLLIGSAQRGRAFVGTVKSQTALQPRLLDEKLTSVMLVDWAAWVASTTFPFTGLMVGYDKPEVDAVRSAVRDTFLGVSEPPARSDHVRGNQFSTHRRGYDRKQVDAFLETAALRLAALEATGRPTAGALVSGATLFGWAEWVESTSFPIAGAGGYNIREVLTFQEAIRDTFLGVREPPVRSDDARRQQFPTAGSSDDAGYYRKQVDAFLEAAGIRLAAMEATEATGRQEGPLVSGAILTEWAHWAESTRFSTTAGGRKGYATAEVDTFRDELRNTFRGLTPPPLTWDDIHRKWPDARTDLWFSTTRGGSGSGYHMQEVDAFLNTAKLRLAAIRRIERQPNEPSQRDLQPPAV